MLNVICNTVSGNKDANEFIEKYFKPLINQYKVEYNFISTNYAGHAEDIGKALALNKLNNKDSNDINNSEVDICVIGGDGTCHEILQGVYGNDIKIKTNLVLIPLGTANALYHSTHSSSTLDKDSVDYKLLSIKSYLSKQSNYLNLNTANVYIDDKPHQIGHVVVSTAVHAALLHRSEELRQTDNSINRFKTAFSEVCKHWTQGTVSLSGCRSYDVNKMKFNDDQQDITLDGPFTYLLATAQVDRLEEKFVIAPNAVSVKGLTIIIVRPLRNFKVKQLYENGKLYDAVNEAANDLTKVMLKAYENGEHLEITNENSQFIVEFFNAQQLTFESKSNDGHNEDYVCVDGSLTKLNKEFAVQLNDSNLLKLIL